MPMLKTMAASVGDIYSLVNDLICLLVESAKRHLSSH